MASPGTTIGQVSLARPRRRGWRTRSIVAAVLAVATAFTAAGCGRTVAHANDPRNPAIPSAASPVPPGSDYLALGDSVPFGYREANTTPKPDYTDAATFVGYPEDVAAALGLHVANAACPGETTASLVTAGAASNGCENNPKSAAGYRTAFPLHVSYSGTQLDDADSYLKAHPDTRLVTLMIGANDGFICQETTKDRCASEFGSVLTTVEGNVQQILSNLREQAGYQGQIVLVNYYSTDYSSASGNAASQALNKALDAAAKPFVVDIADGYGVWQQAAAQAGGDSCKAGLLTILSDGTCGVHPSAAGHALLALAVEKAIRR